MIKTVMMCFFCTLVHVPSIIMRYEPFKESISAKQKRTLSVIYAIALILNAILYYWVLSNGQVSIEFYKYNVLLFSVVMVFANAFVIRHRVKEHIFAFGMTAIVVYLMLSLTAFVQDKFPFDDRLWQITTNAVIVCVMFAVLYPLLNRLMHRTVTPMLSPDSREYLKNIWFTPAAMFLAGLFSFPMDQYIATPLQLMSRLLIGVATLFICRSISYDYSQLRKREELINSLDRQKEYYAALSEKVEEARKSRHDFKHHISTMKAFVDKTDYQGLSEYINKLSEVSIMRTFIPFTGNSAADGIIYHYVLLCEKDTIAFEVEGMLKNVQVSDVDLCVLLGNALENAYTACLTAQVNRFIHLSFSQKDVLTVTVQNSFDGVVLTKNDAILSRKRHNTPGIGLSSMRSICEKYSGTMRTDYDNNVFSLMLLLN